MNLLPGQRYRLGIARVPVEVRETHLLGVDYELHSTGGWCKWFVMGGQVCTLTGRARGKPLFGPTGMTIENDLAPSEEMPASTPTNGTSDRL